MEKGRRFSTYKHAYSDKDYLELVIFKELQMQGENVKTSILFREICEISIVSPLCAKKEDD